MDLFGIGWIEFITILIIILLVAGPRDIEKSARGLGRALNRLYRSPNYQVIRRASEEIRNLPNRLAREAQIEELRNLPELKEAQQELRDAAETLNSIGQGKPFRAWTEDLNKPEAPPAAKPTTPAPPPATPAPAPTEPNTPTPPRTDEPRQP